MKPNSGGTPPTLWVTIARAIVPVHLRDEAEGDLLETWAQDRHGTWWRRATLFWFHAASIAARGRRRHTLLERGCGSRLARLGDAFAADCHDALRSLRRSPGFGVAASLIFATGIGLNVAAFSVIDRLMFRPLPYANPERLVQIHLFSAKTDLMSAAFLPYEVTAAIGQQAASFSDLAWEEGWTESTVPAPGDNPLRLAGVTSNALDVLGVRPVLGRNFVPSDGGLTGEFAVLLAHDTWRARFGSSDAVLSVTWRKENRRYRVVGVLPPEFLRWR
jgi:hypothetical protein